MKNLSFDQKQKSIQASWFSKFISNTGDQICFEILKLADFFAIACHRTKVERIFT